jgi:hypothetical protein
VNHNLPPIYGCVQAGHAVAQWLLDNRATQVWNNSYLIYLYADLEKWIYKLTQKSYKFSTFNEPDLNNQLTAIAIENDGSIFRNLKKVE